MAAATRLSKRIVRCPTWSTTKSRPPHGSSDADGVAGATMLSCVEKMLSMGTPSGAADSSIMKRVPVRS